MDHQLQDYFQTVVEVASEAGEVVKEGFHDIDKKIETKASFADLVTETDEAVEKLIISKLSAKYPTHKFIGEESVSAGKHCVFTDDPTWIIDPIDGTTNFVHRIPQTCISIGLTVNKQPVIGLIYAPVLDEMYTAIKGQGAHLNGKSISVSHIQDLKMSVVIVEGGNTRGEELVTKMENTHKIIEASHGTRSYGSAALNMCFIARGQCEAYVEYGIHIWDIAAGTVILTEAGGVVIDPSGKELDLLSRRVLCASCQTVAESIVPLLKHIELDRD